MNLNREIGGYGDTFAPVPEFRQGNVIFRPSHLRYEDRCEHCEILVY